VSVQQNKIRAIIEKIWSKVKEPKPMSGDGIVDAIDEVYAAGEDNGIAETWEGIQDGGNLTEYGYHFYNWKISRKTFKPQYDIAPTAANYTFYNCHKANSDEIIDFEQIEKEQGIKIDFSNCKALHHVFNGAEIDVINVIDVRNASDTNALYWTFCGVTGSGQSFGHPLVKRINKFIVGEKTDRFYMTFYYALDLEHCGFEGEISKNGLELNMCKKLDHESLMSAMNCLKDYSTDTSGTVWKVILGATNLAKLTADEKAIATGKGWVLE
jgi:hypothetical protein